MFEIQWERLNPDSFYYNHGNFVFKKRKVKDYYVYHIWKGEELLFNTYNQYEFLRKAKYVVEHGFYPTGIMY